MQLTNEELRIAQQALNEVVNGPEAIEDWEFATRMGATRIEAKTLMEKIAAIRAQQDNSEGRPG
jgi:hypothetical protein